MFLFKRKTNDDLAPVDLDAMSPRLGIKYKDVLVLNQLILQGADLSKPRHALYYLYFPSRETAEQGALEARSAGYACDVRDPLPSHPGTWSLVCERSDALLDPPGVRAADELFQGIADRYAAEFDGWEAAGSP